MARYANKQNLTTLVEALRGEYQTPSWVKQAEELGDSMDIIDGSLSAVVAKESDGSQAGPILSLSAKGWAEQDTTTGKNLFDVNGFVNFGGIQKTRGTWSASGNELVLVASGSDSFCGNSGQPNAYGAQMGPQFACSANSAYTLSCSSTDFNKFFVNFYQTDGTYISNYSATTSTFTFTTPANCAYFCFRVGKSDAVSGTTYRTTIQLELGSIATAYEPYTGGAPSPSPSFPQEIRVCRGRNLFSYGTTAVDVTTTYRNLAYQRLTVTQVDSSALKFTACNGDYSTAFIELAGLDGTLDYSFSYEIEQNNTGYTPVIQKYGAQTNTDKLTIMVYARNGNAVLDTSKSFILRNIQVERGSVATPYVPYGYVGMDVYDGNTHVSTTPIPLPSRGWVAGLPDGTCDTLTLNGAGKVTWERATNEVVLDGSESWTLQNSGKRVRVYRNDAIGSVGDNDKVSIVKSSHFAATSPANTWNGSIGVAIATNTARTESEITVSDGTGSMTVDAWTTWLASNPVTVLYPLATPVTEDAGYIEMPEIPVGAKITIPELDDLGVKYCVDDAANELARMWSLRLEYETGESVKNSALEVLSSIAPIEGSVSSGNYSVGEYVVFDGGLCKVTTAIASGEPIEVGTNVEATTIAAEILSIVSE